MKTRIPTAILALAVSLSLSAPSRSQAYNQSYSPQDGEQDPPSRVARLSLLEGNVSLEPAGVDDFSAAELNYPLTVGDRVYADNAALTELQTSGLALRLGNGADLTVTSLSDYAAQFGLAQGSVRLRTRDLSLPQDAPDGGSIASQALVEIDTPNGAIVVLRAGNLRVDSYPQDDTTVVTVTSGQVEVTASGPNGEYTQILNAGQALRLQGANPVYAGAVRPPAPDNLDRFDADRERERQQSLAAAGAYADSGMVGLADLGRYGDWAPNQDYGQVWFPRAVPADWTPYSVGHWAWVAPWGWTWVDAEPWGFAPFHYGRWASFGGPGGPGGGGQRWGWVPGPPPTLLGGGRPVRAVYSPALVAFVGGAHFSLSIGLGGGKNAGITGWFPLGPREAYQPPYHASTSYVNRVNVTNIYTRDPGEARRAYGERSRNLYDNNRAGTDYVNRRNATTAIDQRDFAAGRRIQDAHRSQFDPRARQQLDQAPIMAHPTVTPAVGSAAPIAPPRAVPPMQGRPVLETRRGFDDGRRDTGNRDNGNRDVGSRDNGNRFGQGRQDVAPAPVSTPAGSPAGRNPNRPVATPPQDPAAPGNPAPGSRAPGSPAPGSRSPFQTPAPPATRRGNPQPPAATPAPVAAPAETRPINPTGPGVGGARSNLYDPHTVDETRPTHPNPGAAPGTSPALPAPGRPQRGGFPEQRPTSPVVAPAPVAAPVATRAPAATPAPGPPPTRPPAEPAPAPVQAPRSPDRPRPLVNRNQPQQAPQPPFEQQQREIDRTEPGRPLSPQQVQQMRRNQPAPAPPTPAQPAPAPAAQPAPAPAPATPAEANPNPGRRDNRPHRDQPPPS